MADRRYHTSKGRYSGGVSRSMRDDDFEEDEVWGFAQERKDSSPKLRFSRDSSSGSSTAWQHPNTAERIIPRANYISHETNLVHRQSSAPVNIPDWSKIYGKVKVNPKNGTKFSSWDDDGKGVGEFVNDSKNFSVAAEHNENNDNDEDDEENEMIPPHEWIARKLARSQISSFSVCEGIGRTLKGRDLSRVRNAVLTKTGFLE